MLSVELEAFPGKKKPGFATGLLSIYPIFLYIPWS